MTRLTITILAAILSLTPFVPPADAQGFSVEDAYGHITLDGDRAVIPITLAGTQVLVDGVMINGQGPFRFMFDTGGAGGGRIDVTLAEKLGLEPVGEVQGGDGSGRPGPTMPVYSLESLQIGGLRAENVRVLSRDYNRFGADARGHIDGILGFHLFQEFLLTLDYGQREIRLNRGALPVANGRNVLDTDPDAMAPTITVTMANASFEAHIDSGSMGPITVPQRVADQLTFVDEPVVIGQARTVSGPFDILSAMYEGDIRIGEFTVSQPAILIAPPMRTVNLGGQFMRDFAWTFDQKNHRLQVEPVDPGVRQGAPRHARIGMAPTRVPMEMLSGRPVIEATINGHGPYKFILDTGARTVVLNSDLAAELELPEQGRSQVGAPGAPQNVEVREHTLDSITVGDAEFTTIPAISWVDDDMQRALGGVRGVIGMTVFTDGLLTFDFPAEHVEISRGSLSALDASSPYTIDHFGYPSITIDVAGASMSGHIDTGNPGSIMLPGALEPELPLESPSQVVGRGRVAGGEFEIRAATLDGDATIAGQQIRHPALHFNDLFEQANIGSALLSEFVLTIDQVNHRVLLKRPSNQTPRSRPAQRRTYGFMPAMSGDGPIEIRGVVPGSIAERAGLKTGDRIIVINGVNLADLDQDARGAAFRDSPLTLVVDRDGERVTIRMSHDDGV